jgi:hypothetical protein
VFLIDVSKSSSDNQMLFYAVSVMKEVMSRPEFDSYVVMLYTYDTNLHCYSFENGSASRIIFDRNVDIGMEAPPPESFSAIRVRCYLN